MAARLNAFPCPPYPHHSWLAHCLAVSPPSVFDIYDCRHVTHRLLLVTAGEAAVSWDTNGTSTAFHAGVDDIGFFPRDDHVHTLSFTTAHGFRAYALLIPPDHLRGVCDAEGLRIRGAPPATPLFRDTPMQASLLRLSTPCAGRSISEDIGDEIAARQVILRLCALSGGGIPEWHRDTSVFTPPIMRQLVAHVDSCLGTHVSLGAMADTVGLSPSHFARKFRLSTGLSVNRFMNTRRICMSFAMLRDHDQPLAAVSLALGFSSQSHFTRLFSGLAGMTPQRFRRLHRRMRV